MLDHRTHKVLTAQERARLGLDDFDEVTTSASRAGYRQRDGSYLIVIRVVLEGRYVGSIIRRSSQ